MALSKEEKENRNVLKSELITRINSLRKKRFDPKLIDDLSMILKVFLIKFFNFNYEFTHDELLKEIRNFRVKEELRNRILSISSLVQEIKYGNILLSKEHFKWIIDESEKIINLSITGKEFSVQEKLANQQKEMSLPKIDKKENKNKKPGFFSRIFGSKPKPKKEAKSKKKESKKQKKKKKEEKPKPKTTKKTKKERKTQNKKKIRQ